MYSLPSGARVTHLEAEPGFASFDAAGVSEVAGFSADLPLPQAHRLSTMTKHRIKLSTFNRLFFPVFIFITPFHFHETELNSVKYYLIQE
jgi:hypothetical protein